MSSEGSNLPALSTFATTHEEKSPDVLADLTDESVQEAQVSKFASLFARSSAKELMQYVSASVTAHDVVCTLPSLEIQPASPVDATSLLPKVGEHHATQIPKMAASVFINAADTSSVPPRLEDGAVHKLGALTYWTRSSLVYAPEGATKNISASFKYLVDSRFRAWTLLMLRHSLSAGDSGSRSNLFSILACSIQSKFADISLSALSLPECARGHPKEADVVLPLLFSAEIRFEIVSRLETVHVRAPGTISGSFAKDSATPGLTMVDIWVDPGALLESMVEQARLVVFKVIAQVTSVNPDQPVTAVHEGGTPPSSTILPEFTSALNVSAEAAAQSPRMLKARSSALRLNSILHGKSEEKSESTVLAPLDKRKSRSVKWNHPMEVVTIDESDDQEEKRHRLVEGHARLKSMKSFGRPHAEHSTERRNATFNEFGGSGPTWGKDGKLKNHPVPGGGLISTKLSSLQMSATPSSHQNATFDFAKTASRVAFHPQMQSVMEGGAPRPGGSGNLTRTATALENWLVEATNSGNT